MDTSEEWRRIPNHPDYEASSLGRVRSWKYCRRYPERELPAPMTPAVSKATGRYDVMLSEGGRKFNRDVHTLVAAAFLGPRPVGMDVCHNNGDCLDNRLANLRYDTREANMADARRHGTLAQGERHGISKLNADDVREIRRLATEGLSHTTIATRFVVTRENISTIIRGETWVHV